MSIAALGLGRHTLVRVFGRCAPPCTSVNVCTNFREFPLCEVRAPLYLPRTQAATLVVSTVLGSFSARSELMWDVCLTANHTGV